MLIKNFTSKKIFIGVVILFFVIVFVIYSVAIKNKKIIYDGSMEQINLGVEASILSSAVWIAENQGYFEQNGIDINIEEFDSGRLSFMDMLKGGVEVAVVAPTPIMFESFKGQDFSTFATFVYSDDDLKVIADLNSGIKVTKDLVGKRIGTPAGTTGQFYLSAYLTNNGMSLDEVIVIDISPSNLPDALNNQIVDAIVIWEPHAYNAQKLLDANANILSDSSIYRETFNFLALNDYIDQNKDLLGKFLQSIKSANEYIQNNPTESQRIVSDHLNLGEDVVTRLWGDFVFELSLEQSLILTLEEEARWAIKNDLTENKVFPNYFNFINTDILESVFPEDVTIIR